MSLHVDRFLSAYLCGYRKGFSTQQALKSLLEKWKSVLDRKGDAGVILMDLSEAFDTLNHDLLIAKLHECGLPEKSLAKSKGQYQLQQIGLRIRPIQDQFSAATLQYIYIYKYQKNTQKLTKAFERFLRILLQLCRSRFRLIISEQKFRCKSQGTGVEKELFRTQSSIQTKYGGVQASSS